jgi:hypothetical protein
MQINTDKMTANFDIIKILKNDVTWDVRLVALAKTDVSGESNASIIRVTIIGVLGSVLCLLVTSNIRSSSILVTLMM